MPTTVDGLIIALLFVAPGLQFELGIERQVGYWRTGLSDRLLRFFVWSVMFQAFAAPVTYWAWDRYRSDGARVHFDAALWAVMLAYVVVPLALGLVVGHATWRRRRWTRWIVGKDPAPTAWDWLWSRERHGTAYVRVKLKTGGWVAAIVGPQAVGFASSYPAQADVYFPVQLQVDPETGEILVDREGSPQRRQWGFLVRWDEVELLEFQEIE